MIACKSQAVVLVAWVAACVVVWMVAWEAGVGEVKNATVAEKSDILRGIAARVVLADMEVVLTVDMVEVAAAELLAVRPATPVEDLDTCREIALRDKNVTTVGTSRELCSKTSAYIGSIIRRRSRSCQPRLLNRGFEREGLLPLQTGWPPPSHLSELITVTSFSSSLLTGALLMTIYDSAFLPGALWLWRTVKSANAELTSYLCHDHFLA